MTEPVAGGKKKGGIGFFDCVCVPFKVEYCILVCRYFSAQSVSAAGPSSQLACFARQGPIPGTSCVLSRYLNIIYISLFIITMNAFLVYTYIHVYI